MSRLNQEVTRILALPDVKQRLDSYDFNVTAATPQEVDKVLRADIEVFTRIAKEAGLRPQ